MSAWGFALALTAAAQAGSVDIHGFGAESIGRGIGGVAVPDGAKTVFRNPALLQSLSWAEASVGYGVYRGAFPKAPPVHWDTNRDGYLDELDDGLQLPAERPRSDGVSVTIGRNVGSKVGIALNAFFPSDQILRLRTTEPALPSWVMYGNRTQRVELGLGLGAELYKGLSLGVSTELIAKARYRIYGTLDIAIGGADEGTTAPGDLLDEVRVDVHEMTLDLVPRFIPLAGFHWDVGVLLPALEGLDLGVAWRGSSGIPVDADIDLQLNGALQDMGDLETMNIALVMPVELSIYDHYVPERWSFGAAYQPEGWPLVYVDVHRTQWAQMRVNVAHVTDSAIRSQLFQVEEDLIDDANQYSATFTNTTSVHTGMEVDLPGINTGGKAGRIESVIRLGLAHIPSPLQSQSDGTTFLDADRILFAGGFGLTHQDPWGLVPGPVSWDFFYTRHQLASGELQPEAQPVLTAGAPVNGQAIPIGGHLWSAGMQFSVSF